MIGLVQLPRFPRLRTARCFQLCHAADVAADARNPYSGLARPRIYHLSSASSFKIYTLADVAGDLG